MPVRPVLSVCILERHRLHRGNSRVQELRMRPWLFCSGGSCEPAAPRQLARPYSASDRIDRNTARRGFCPESCAADRGASEAECRCSGIGAFTLTVYGANFVPGAVVNWNGQPRKTTFVSVHELRAHILATDVAKNTAGLISVTNPGPGGGNSSASWAQVEVHEPVTTITFNPPQSYSFGGYLLLAADFNHDEILDLVGQYASDLVFHPGKGNGVFPFGSIAAYDYDSNGGAFGDFNGDGNLDLAYSKSPPNNHTVGAGVVLGDGHGKFKFASNITQQE